MKKSNFHIESDYKGTSWFDFLRFPYYGGCNAMISIQINMNV
jgi:hypothetical protein